MATILIKKGKELHSVEITYSKAKGRSQWPERNTRPVYCPRPV